MGAITILQEAKNKLLHYHFPGNVRELKAIIDLAAVMCDNNEIKADDIIFNSTQKDGVFVMDGKTLREQTCEIIKIYLKKYNDDVIATAQALDIGKSTIYKMIQSGELN